MKLFTLCLLGASAVLAAPAVDVSSPVNVIEKRDMCGSWDTQTRGQYKLYNNLWGAGSGVGWQCSNIDSQSGSTVSWHTSWNWSGGQYSVKSYANIVLQTTSKKISAVGSIPTKWSWGYTGTNMVADVAYDIFTGDTPTSSHRYEVMIWLAAMGGAGPISSTGKPIATPNIGGIKWNLHKGPNGSMTVFSFVAPNWVTNFNANIKDFLKYLVNSQGVSSSQYIQAIGAGTEPFTGSNAKLTTYSYSLAY